jgi:hypothetical protein
MAKLHPSYVHEMRRLWRQQLYGYFSTHHWPIA